MPTTDPLSVADQSSRPRPLGMKAIAAERVRRFIKRHPALLGASERFWRVVDAMPRPVERMFDSLRQPMLRETGWDEVLVVMQCLESEAVPYWLAGGWGVDALIGRQTRRHKDLDVVIEDFERNEPKVRRALLALGFAHLDRDTAGVWMPTRSNFEDGAGHRVELLEIDWEYLKGVMAPHPEHASKAAAPSTELAGDVLTVGAMNGRPVPCLTSAAQLLFHTGFHLEAAGSVDVSLLRSELGTSTGSSGT